jgi:hypothetical protein
MHIEISEPVRASSDLPFASSLSRFGGTSIQLSFGNPGLEIVSIVSSGDDWAFSYASAAFTVSAQNCELTNWNIGETSASGTFDCANASARAAADGSRSDVSMKGTFEASN